MHKLGLHISHTTTKAVLMNLQGDKATIVKAEEFPVPDDMIANGDIVNFDVFTTHLKQIRRKFGRVDTVVSIPSSFYVCTIIRLPEMEDSELANAMEYEMEQYIKKGVLSDYIWGHVPINESIVDMDKQFIKNVITLAVAFPRKYVLDVLESFKKAGLRVVAIESEDLALWRAFSTTPHLNYISIHINRNELQVSTYTRGNLFYIRPKSSIGAHHLFSDINPSSYQLLLGELRRTFEYYMDRTKTQVDTIFLTSPDSIPDSFLNILRQDMPVPIERWRMNTDETVYVNNIQITCNTDVPGLDETYAIPIGLTLHPLFADKVINLIPKDYVRKNRITQVVRMGVGVAAVLALMMGSFVSYVHVMENKLENLMVEKNNLRRQLEQARQLQNEIAALQGQAPTQLGPMPVAGVDAFHLGDFLYHIEKNIPKDVKIHNIDYPDVNGTMTMKIMADSQQSIGSFMLLLDEFSEIQAVKTNHIEQYKFGNITYLAAEIHLELKNGGIIK